MEDRGKEEVKILTNEGLFVNSNTVFVEYYDIIKMPWFSLLAVIPKNKKLEAILDIDRVSYPDMASLLEFYCNRKNRNFLKDLSYDDIIAMDTNYDEMLNVLMNNEIFYTIANQLNIVPALYEISHTKICNKMYIYTETYSKWVENDIEKIFNQNPTVQYIHGDFKEAVKDINTDCTYFLSDFQKIPILEEMGRFDCSSFLLPVDYAYNYVVENGERTPIIDFDYYSQNYMFRLAYFAAALNFDNTDEEDEYEEEYDDESEEYEDE